MPLPKNKLPLSRTHPALCKEADGWDTSSVSAGSGANLAWRCKQGHSWTAPIYSRARGGNGCPICANRKVVTGINDLATTHPELAAQAHQWDPSKRTARSHIRVEWKCDEGHLWSTNITTRVRSGSGCPFCTGQKAILGKTDLATTHPSLAKEAHGWDTSTVMAGSNRRYLWKCALGHVWTATANSRLRGSGCPFCSNKKVLPGFNDLATTHPELAKEADGWDSQKVSFGSGKKFRWKCREGHTWIAAVGDRSSGTGCPVCANKTILVGKNDLTTTHPDIALQADGWDPTTQLAGSAAKVPWRCARGHTWTAHVYSRTSGDTGCPVCGNRIVLAGFNDLATTHPDLALEADGWDPQTVVAGSNTKLHWKCRYGHKWTAPPAARSSRRTGCPVCSGNLVHPGFNDFATKHPTLATQAHRWDPQTVTAGSGVSKWWKCEEGHKWKAAPVTRGKGVGCPTCATSGFAPERPAWLYLLYREADDLLQIGITNQISQRLTRHALNGFQSLDVRPYKYGHDARHDEGACLSALKRKGAQTAKEANLEPFDGYSESWLKSSYPVKSLKEILDLVHQMEDKESKSIKPS